MSTTAKNKKRYSITVWVKGTKNNPDEEKTFCHNFCSHNIDTYIQNYHKKLLGYGWYYVKVLNITER